MRFQLEDGDGGSRSQEGWWEEQLNIAVAYCGRQKRLRGARKHPQSARRKNHEGRIERSPKGLMTAEAVETSVAVERSKRSFRLVLLVADPMHRTAPPVWSEVRVTRDLPWRLAERGGQKAVLYHF